MQGGTVAPTASKQGAAITTIRELKLGYKTGTGLQAPHMECSRWWGCNMDNDKTEVICM